MDKLKKEDVINEAYRYKEVMVSYAFGYLRNHVDAEDVVQESFIVICDKWQNYRKGTRITSWLLQVTRLKCLEFLRKRKKDRIIKESDFFPEGYGELWSQSALDRLNHRKDALHECVSHLSEEAKKLIYNYYYKGYSCNKLAEISSQSVEYQKNHLYRVRSRLRKCMKGKIADTDGHSDSESTPIESVLDEHFNQEPSTVLNQSPFNDWSNDPSKQQEFVNYLLDWTALAQVSASFVKKPEERCTEIENFASPFLDNPEEIHRNEVMPQMQSLQGQSNLATYTKWIYGMAAIIAIGIGTLFITNNTGKHLAVPHIAAVEGESWIQRNGSATPEKALLNATLAPGDKLYTEDGGLLKIAYRNEATFVSIEENSQLELLIPNDANSQQKQLQLNTGSILCEVDKQQGDSPMTIDTPQSRVTVLGTRFKLRASPGQTQLTMFEGMVSMQNTKTKSSKIVTAGQYAKASDNEDSITIGQGEYRDVVTEDPKIPKGDLLSEDALKNFRISSPEGRLSATIDSVTDAPFETALFVSAKRKSHTRERATLIFPIEAPVPASSVLNVTFYSRSSAECRGSLGVALRNQKRNNFSLSQNVIVKSKTWQKHTLLLSGIKKFAPDEMELALTVTEPQECDFEIGGITVQNNGDFFVFQDPLNRDNFKVNAPESISLDLDRVNLSSLVDGWNLRFSQGNTKSCRMAASIPHAVNKGDRFVAILPHRVSNKGSKLPFHIEYKFLGASGKDIGMGKTTVTRPSGNATYHRTAIVATESAKANEWSWQIDIQADGNAVGVTVPLLIKLDASTDLSALAGLK